MKRLELYGMWSCMYNFYCAKQLLPAEKKTPGFFLKIELGKEMLLMVGFIGLMQERGKDKAIYEHFSVSHFPN